MKLLLTTLLLLLPLLGLLSVVTGEEVVEAPGVQKCTMPQKFEGQFKINVKTAGHFGNTQQAFGTGTVHVDATNGRAAVFETLYSRGQLTKVNIIMRETNKKTTAYFAAPEPRQCVKQFLNAPLLPGTVPKNTSLHVREAMLGGVPAQVWEAEVKEGEGQARVEVYLSRDTCMLMSVHIKALVNGQSLTATETFSDMKEGVQDESVFDLPEYCVKPGYPLRRQPGLDGEGTPQVQHQEVDGANRVPSRHHDWHLQHAASRHRVRRQLGI